MSSPTRTKLKSDPVGDKDAFVVSRLHKTKTGHNASKRGGLSYSRMREIFNENIDTV